MRDLRGRSGLDESLDMGVSLFEAEVLEEEVIEAIQVLLLGIQEIRYLCPREPIPRSEYLLNYHVRKGKK